MSSITEPYETDLMRMQRAGCVSVASVQFLEKEFFLSSVQ